MRFAMGGGGMEQRMLKLTNTPEPAYVALPTLKPNNAIPLCTRCLHPNRFPGVTHTKF